MLGVDRDDRGDYGFECRWEKRMGASRCKVLSNSWPGLLWTASLLARAFVTAKLGQVFLELPPCRYHTWDKGAPNHHSKRCSAILFTFCFIFGNIFT